MFVPAAAGSRDRRQPPELDCPRWSFLKIESKDNRVRHVSPKPYTMVLQLSKRALLNCQYIKVELEKGRVRRIDSYEMLTVPRVSWCLCFRLMWG